MKCRYKQLKIECCLYLRLRRFLNAGRRMIRAGVADACCRFGLSDRSYLRRAASPSSALSAISARTVFSGLALLCDEWDSRRDEHRGN